jgi:hypothetical protein
MIRKTDSVAITTFSRDPNLRLDFAETTQGRFKSKPEAIFSTIANRWDEKAGLQRDALSSQIIDALEAQEIRR